MTVSNYACIFTGQVAKRIKALNKIIHCVSILLFSKRAARYLSQKFHLPEEISVYEITDLLKLAGCWVYVGVGTTYVFLWRFLLDSEVYDAGSPR